MSLLCKLGMHNSIEKEREVKTELEDIGACVEEWRRTYKLMKCTKCGEEWQKINRIKNYRGSPIKDEELINRRWKDE